MARAGVTGPAATVLPWPVGLTIDLGGNERLAANLNGFQVWPDGFRVRLSIRVLPLPPGKAPLSPPRFPGRTPGTAPTVVLTADSAGQQLDVVGGGSGANGWIEATYWISPLPAPGQLRFRLTWSDAGVLGAEASIDARPILAAAHAAGGAR